MFCTNCGEKIADDAKFCEKCGKKVVGNNIDFQNKRVEKEKKPDNDIKQMSNYEQIYSQAENGVKTNLLDRVRDSLFYKITKIRVVRVTGQQLALIFKKYFVDTCENIDELQLLKNVPKFDLAGRKLKKNNTICYNKAKYRWIKHCEKEVIWELRTSWSQKDIFEYRNNTKKFLEEKECKLKGIPYDSNSFVPIKNKSKVPLLIALVVVWGVVIWNFATNGGEGYGGQENENVNYIEDSQEQVSDKEKQDTEDNKALNDTTSSDNDTINSDKDMANSDNDNLYESNTQSAGNNSTESEIIEEEDYVLESDDGQMEVVLSYTFGRGGTCEFYANYYDDDGNVVNDKYDGTFAETKEGEGTLDFEEKGVSIPYHYDYDTDTETQLLVLDIDGEEWYLEKIETN